MATYLKENTEYRPRHFFVNCRKTNIFESKFLHPGGGMWSIPLRRTAFVLNCLIPCLMANEVLPAKDILNY